MPVFEHVPVNARLIHKEHLDDVLVSNFRGELPTWLPADLLEEHAHDNGLTAGARGLLAAHFHPVQPGQLGVPFSDPAGVLVRRSIPTTLPLELAKEPGFDWVRAYYAQGADGLVLDAKYLPEHLEEALAARFVPTRDQLTPATRHRIAQITDSLACNIRSDRHTMNMINDLENYFFYRKHHEHVPGIMLIEVARQAIYAQYYHTSSHRRGEITLSIKTLTSEFEDYVDANYPVSITVDTLAPDVPKAAMFERRIARFYQRGRQVAAVDILGVPIKMKLFERLRTIKPEPGDWFIPIKGFAPSVLFRDEEGKRIEGKLRKVSQTGMDIVFQHSPETDAPLDFVINVDGIGYIDGKAHAAALETGPDGVVGRLDLVDLTREGKRKWLEAIKNYAHVETTAGV